MGTPRQIDVHSTLILRRYFEDQISTNFHIISTYFFRCNFAVEKSTLFSRTFFDVISLVKISTFFPRTFFDVISLVEKSILFPLTSTYVILMVEKFTLFASTFCDEISMGKFSRSFLVSCKLMKTFEEIFLCIVGFEQGTFRFRIQRFNRLLSSIKCF